MHCSLLTAGISGNLVTKDYGFGVQILKRLTKKVEKLLLLFCFGKIPNGNNGKIDGNFLETLERCVRNCRSRKYIFTE